MKGLFILSSFFLLFSSNFVEAADKLIGQPCGDRNLGKCIEGWGDGTCTRIGQTVLLKTGARSLVDWSADECVSGAKCCVVRTVQPGGICGGSDLNGDGNRISIQGSCFRGGCPAGIPELPSNSEYFPQCASGLKCCNSSGMSPAVIASVVQRSAGGGGAPGPQPGQSQTEAPGPQPGGTPQNILFINPLGGITTVNSFATHILGYLQGVVIVIAVIFIVISGIMYMTSFGNESRMTSAKNAMTAALIGIAVILIAPSFLMEIINVLGGAGAVDTGPITGASSVTDIAYRILNFLLSIIGILAIIGLLIGGGMYLTAMGDERRMDKAKDMIKASIIGIIVAMASLVIVKQIVALILG